MGGTLPRCARCLRSVDEVKRIETVRGDVTFIAYCHGDSESVTVTRAELARDWQCTGEMAFTVAFSQSRKAEQRQGHPWVDSALEAMEAGDFAKAARLMFESDPIAQAAVAAVARAGKR